MSIRRQSTVAVFAMCAFAAFASADIILIHDGSETNFGSDLGFLDFGNSQDSSLHLALAAAQTGDTVEIRDNIAWQHVRNNGYRMNTAGVTLRGGDGFSPSIVSSHTGTNSFFYVNAPDITIENIILDNSSSKYGNYAIQASDKIGATNTYTAQNLTINNMEFRGMRGAMNSGSGELDNFTFTNNIVDDTRYGLGKSGLNYGAGLSTIEGNTFIHSASGDAGAPDSSPLSSNDRAIWIESLVGDLSILNNIFTDYDGHYAVFSDVVSPAEITLSGNSFGSGIGGTGALLDLVPLPGGGHAVGLIPTPGAMALLPIAGVFAVRRRR